MPARDDMPSTLQRSPKHAQDIFAAALDAADKEYGNGERARRTAYAAVKREYEKVGDHWERKPHHGPSEDRPAQGPVSRPTHGGVDTTSSKQHLLDIAKRLEIRGRSSMTKDQLVAAIQKANDRATAKARQGD